jgi:hypothetical protein
MVENLDDINGLINESDIHLFRRYLLENRRYRMLSIGAIWADFMNFETVNNVTIPCKDVTFKN